MKILFIAAELAPLVKVGGLADVIGSLPDALVQLGHDVRVIIPCYKAIADRGYDQIKSKQKFDLSLNGEIHKINLLYARLKHIDVYMVESPAYFNHDDVYTADELEQFLFFSEAVTTLLPKLEWQPQIIHVHDWHTALIPLQVKSKNLPYKTVFTIHNLAYQGSISYDFLSKHGLKRYWENTWEGLVPPLNFMVQGIMHADRVTTVSKTYAKEILLAEHGMGLHEVLGRRKNSVIGIINGIDYVEYNPATDSYLYATYDAARLSQKYANKTALQKELKLTAGADVPLVGMVQRLEEQKGMDILEKSLDEIMRKTDVQIVLQGRGRPRYESMLAQIASRYSGRMTAIVSFDNVLARRIYAGSDMFLMPSLYEPCGLGQMIAMRYGTLPVVHFTGGLADTIVPLNGDLSQGSGFVFQDYTGEALLSVMQYASQKFKDKDNWQGAMRRVMSIDFSWRNSAAEYEKMYAALLETEDA